MADAANGDFHHIESPEVLEEVFAEELAAAGSVQARAVAVDITLPGAVAIAANLNGYPQQDAEHGITVQLGDIARTKDLVVELTTPVELSAEQVRLGVAVRFTDRDGVAHSLADELVLGVVDPADVADVPERIEVVRRMLDLVDARTRMLAMELYDAGDVGAAKAALAGGKARAAAVAYSYALPSAVMASHDASLAEIDEIDRMLDAGSISAAESKRMHGRSRDINRSQEPKQQ